MLFELIIFAVVFVVLQAVVSLGLLAAYMHWLMSEKQLRKLMKTSMKVTQEVSEELDIY